MAKNPPKGNVSPTAPVVGKGPLDDVKARAVAHDAAAGATDDDGGGDSVVDGAIIGALVGLPFGQPVAGAVIGGLVDKAIDDEAVGDDKDGGRSPVFTEGRTMITAPIPVKNEEGEVVRVIKGPSGSQAVRDIPFVGEDLGKAVDAAGRSGSSYADRLREALDSDPTVAPSRPTTGTPAGAKTGATTDVAGARPGSEFQVTPEELKAAEEKYLGTDRGGDRGSDAGTSGSTAGAAPPAGEEEGWGGVYDDGEPDSEPGGDPGTASGPGAGSGGASGGEAGSDDAGGPPAGSEAFEFEVIHATGTVDDDEFVESDSSSSTETVYRDEEGNWYDAEGNALPPDDAAAYEEAYQEDGMSGNRAPDKDVPPEEEDDGADEEGDGSAEGEGATGSDGGGVGFTPDPDNVDVIGKLGDLFGLAPTRGPVLAGRGFGSSTGAGVTDPPDDDGTQIAPGTVAVDPHAEKLGLLGNPGTPGGPTDFGSGAVHDPGEDYTSPTGAGVTDPADDADAPPVTSGPEERDGSAPVLKPTAPAGEEHDDDGGGTAFTVRTWSGALSPDDDGPDELDDFVIDRDP
ncbi:MAG: hypothetical protein U0V73_06885 [Acidimicrobiia bacterium]